MVGGYIIKPDAFKFRLQIRQLIIDSGITLVEHKIVHFDATMVQMLYPKLKEEILSEAIRHYSSGNSEIGLLEDNNIFEKLLNIGGESTNPIECGSNSIRFLYGNILPKVIGDYNYYYNAFHRTKNEIQTQMLINLLNR